MFLLCLGHFESPAYSDSLRIVAEINHNPISFENIVKSVFQLVTSFGVWEVILMAIYIPILTMIFVLPISILSNPLNLKKIALSHPRITPRVVNAVLFNQSTVLIASLRFEEEISDFISSNSIEFKKIIYLSDLFLSVRND